MIGHLLAAASALTIAVPAAAPAYPQRSAERASPIRTAGVNGVTIAYRIVGPAKGEPIMLLPGTGMQLIEWPPALIDGLIASGFRVILPDMRDTGGSTHFTAAGQPDWAAFFAALQAGRPPALPYRADDMAADMIALLDHLKVPSAHLFGISGGATLGELMALAAPKRVRSLTVVAANSGNPAIPIPADPAAFAGQPQPRADEKPQEALARRVALARILAGRGASFDAVEAERVHREAMRRDADPFGSLRQGATMLALGDLRPRLSGIATRTVVIHGGADPLIAVRSGREVAATIPGARFVEIAGMGHDLPPPHVPALLDQIGRNAKASPVRN